MCRREDHGIHPGLPYNLYQRAYVNTASQGNLEKRLEESGPNRFDPSLQVCTPIESVKGF